MPAPITLDRYQLLERLGAGGMAEVYLALMTGAEEFERLLALKLVLEPLIGSEEFVGMFIDEAKALAGINHANLVQVYELGRSNDTLFIAMELVAGRDLRQVIARSREVGAPIPMQWAAFVAGCVADGLDYAHNVRDLAGRPRRLVHRDVSPGNVLVGFAGEVKVADFGIAKGEGRRTSTRPGMMKGNVAYVSPEQARGEPVDHRSDIFSLGTVLFELATGRPLYNGASDLSVLQKVARQALPNIARGVPQSHRALVPILERALAKQADLRYPTAAAMANDLRQISQSQGTMGAREAAQIMQVLFADEYRRWPQKVRTLIKRAQAARQIAALAPAPAKSEEGDFDNAKTTIEMQRPVRNTRLVKQSTPPAPVHYDAPIRPPTSNPLAPGTNMVRMSMFYALLVTVCVAIASGLLYSLAAYSSSVKNQAAVPEQAGDP